jgi:hypothetical protein
MAEVVTICELGMVKAKYRYVVPNGALPYYGYRISVSPGTKAKGQFDVAQEDAEQFATELEALAALIRAHAPKRKKPC